MWPLFLLACALAPPGAHGHRTYLQLIPNGDRVVYNGVKVEGLGHLNPCGRGPTNAFGQDFKLAGNQWTLELCQKDSDNDGRTNGEELGDPGCQWQLGMELAAAGPITHPGLAEDVAGTQTFDCPATSDDGMIDSDGHPHGQHPEEVNGTAAEGPDADGDHHPPSRGGHFVGDLIVVLILLVILAVVGTLVLVCACRKKASAAIRHGEEDDMHVLR